MNGNMWMMLLPFLLAKNGSGQGGFNLPPETLLSLLGNNAQNPMMTLLLTMMQKGNKEKAESGKETTAPDVGNIFGRDVATILKTFTEMKSQFGSV